MHDDDNEDEWTTGAYDPHGNFVGWWIVGALIVGGICLVAWGLLT